MGRGPRKEARLSGISDISELYKAGFRYGWENYRGPAPEPPVLKLGQEPPEPIWVPDPFLRGKIDGDRAAANYERYGIYPWGQLSRLD